MKSLPSTMLGVKGKVCLWCWLCSVITPEVKWQKRSLAAEFVLILVVYVSKIVLREEVQVWAIMVTLDPRTVELYFGRVDPMPLEGEGQRIDSACVEHSLNEQILKLININVIFTYRLNM